MTKSSIKQKDKENKILTTAEVDQELKVAMASKSKPLDPAMLEDDYEPKD